jgi:hypothetical protein
MLEPVIVLIFVASRAVGGMQRADVDDGKDEAVGLRNARMALAAILMVGCVVVFFVSGSLEE